MAHLLMIEAPGGNDFDLFEAALAQGHQISFFTADLDYYQNNGCLAAHLDKARQVVEIQPFDYPQLEQRAVEIHEQQPFAAIFCLIDIRMIEAARLAERLQLRFLNLQSATIMRDKFTVRTLLASKGIPQPEFALATDNRQLRTEVERMGLPLLVKPSDGYGSQNIAIFQTMDDLNPFIDPLDHYLPCQTDYGFGVKANDRLLIERYIKGQMIGCDTLTQNGKHIMLGINEKLMYPAPSTAIKGSCFPSNHFDIKGITDYVFAVLDALDFNDGATHTEILITPAGPILVEVNPRLVGAKIPRLLNIALNRSLHNDLIDLHLGKALIAENYHTDTGYAVSRWIISQTTGRLAEIVLPDINNPDIRYLEIFKKPGDYVCYPYQNADRIGYIMTYGKTRQQAEQLADDFISGVQVKLLPD